MSQITAFAGKYAKFLAAALAGVVIVINETAGGGTVHWIDVAAAVLGSLGVALVPNSPAPVAVAKPVVPPAP